LGLLQPIRNLSYVVGSVWHDESNRQERWRRLLLATGWQAWKRLIQTPIVVPLFNGFRFLAYPDCQVSSGVFYTRIPNSRHISFLRAHVNGGTFIDVGAHVGLVSLLLADKIEHALLFEPNPIAADRARENLALNRLGFEVLALALSDATGEVELEKAGGVDSCNRTVDGFTTYLATITVPRITFDQFLQEHGPTPVPVTAVKIDVEGHENAVFRGMESFLKTKRPRIIMFEYLQRTNLVETLATFARVGYRVIELTQQGPAWATEQVPPLQDLFACPEELSAEFVPEALSGDPVSAGSEAA